VKRFPPAIGVLCLAFAALPLRAEDPCTSGPRSGQRPGPYSSLVATGEHRGQSHCFICETADRPAAIVFARGLSDPLGKLATKLDKAVADNKTLELQSWITFLNNDQSAFDPQVVSWAKKLGLRNVPLGVFEDVVGPPSYRLAKDADVTVLLFVKQRVVANFAFRAGELNDEKIAAVMKELPKIVEKK
jgi:hypothetical protein